MKNLEDLTQILKLGYVVHNKNIKGPIEIMWNLWEESNEKLDKFENWKQIKDDFDRNEDLINDSEEIKIPVKIPSIPQDSKSQSDQEIIQIQENNEINVNVNNINGIGIGNSNGVSVGNNVLRPPLEIFKSGNFIIKSRLFLSYIKLYLLI